MCFHCLPSSRALCCSGSSKMPLHMHNAIALTLLQHQVKAAARARALLHFLHSAVSQSAPKRGVRVDSSPNAAPESSPQCLPCPQICCSIRTQHAWIRLDSLAALCRNRGLLSLAVAHSEASANIEASLDGTVSSYCYHCSIFGALACYAYHLIVIL